MPLVAVPVPIGASTADQQTAQPPQFQDSAANEIVNKGFVRSASGRQTLERSTTALSGLLAPPETAPTHAELMERGVPQRQASRVLVRQTEQEAMASIMVPYMAMMVCVLCIIGPTMMIAQIVALVYFFTEGDVECAVPLKWWCTVLWCVSLAISFVRKLLPLICGWESATPENPAPMPFLMKVYIALTQGFVFCWLCLGLHYVFNDGPGSDKPPCKDVASGLYYSVAVLAFGNLFLLIFLAIWMIGLVTVLAWCVRNGVVNSPNAAPTGSLDKAVKDTTNSAVSVVTKEDPIVVENKECSICMIEFNDGKAIVKTSCNHVFHQDCIRKWLERFNKTCPLCREELLS